MKTHDCYNCTYKGSVPGSTHSSCSIISHSVSEELKSTAKMLEASLALGAHALVDENTQEPLVKLDPHGVKKGWANWPLDFDPIWVQSCPFYKPKES
jgi:hypothetical protein